MIRTGGPKKKKCIEIKHNEVETSKYICKPYTCMNIERASIEPNMPKRKKLCYSTFNLNKTIQRCGRLVEKKDVVGFSIDCFCSVQIELDRVNTTLTKELSF